MVAEWKSQEVISNLTLNLKEMGLSVDQKHPKMGCPEMPGFADTKSDFLTEKEVSELAKNMVRDHVEVHYIKGFVQSNDPFSGHKVEKLRESILTNYASTVFKGVSGGSPPKRGEFGEAEILLKPGTTPIAQRPYQMSGERRAAWVTLTDNLIREGKIEPGNGPWLSPSFPVPKKSSLVKEGW